jgi:hypothetical protein
MSAQGSPIQRRRSLWQGAALAALPLTVLLVDGYAMYRVYIARVGNALDFYPIWAGSQQVLLHNQNAYSPEVMHQIQRAI